MKVITGQLWKKVVLDRVSVALSIVGGSLALVAGTLVGPVGGPLAFSAPDAVLSQAAAPFVASPNPVPVCTLAEPGTTVLSWNISRTYKYELRRGNANGTILRQGVGSSKWKVVDSADGESFYLNTTRPVIKRQGGKTVTVQVRDAQYQVTIQHEDVVCPNELPAPTVTPEPTTKPTPTLQPFVTPTPTVVVTPTPTPTVTTTPAPTPTVVVTPTPTPTPVANRVPVGVIDVINCDQNSIVGWVADPDTLNTIVRIRLLDGSTTLAEKYTDVQRDDVNAYLASQYNLGRPVSGPHGYAFDLSQYRLDGKVHLFSLEAQDNTGTYVRMNLNSSANLYCPAVGGFSGSLDVSYVQKVLVDKFTHAPITNIDQRDPSTVTYLEVPTPVGDTLEVCPGPDGKPGRMKNITVTASAAPSGGAVFVKDSATGQEKWVATLVGPGVAMATWTAQLGAGQTPVTYTFRVSNYISGANTIASKVVTVKAKTGACDPGEYSLDYYLVNAAACASRGEYPIAYISATAENVRAGSLSAADEIVVRFRPGALPDVPENWQTLTTQTERLTTSDPNTYAFRTTQILKGQGTYDFFLKFGGKLIYQAEKEYFVGICTF